MGNSITYEYYYNTYCSGRAAQLTPEAFDKYIGQAWREVMSMLTSEYTEEQCDCVFSAVCEVAEQLCRTDTVERVASESIDGYSVTYREKSESSPSVSRTVIRRLAGTGLLYAGVE